MTAPNTPPDDTHDVNLQTPLLVSLGAASLAIASAFMIMIGIQLTLSFSSFADWALILVISYFLTGAAGMVSAIMLAKGSFIASISGLLCALCFLALFWTPTLFGLFAFSMLGCVGFSGISTLLVGVSIPMTRSLAKKREAFFDNI